MESTECPQTGIDPNILERAVMEIKVFPRDAPGYTGHLKINSSVLSRVTSDLLDRLNLSRHGKLEA